MLENFIDWVLNVVDKLGYGGVFLATMLESFFAPLPSEFLLPMVGFLASKGEMSLWVGVIIASFGSYFGTLPFYILSYKYKESVLDKLVAKYGKCFLISEREIEKTERLFEKYGKLFVLFGRLIPGIRSIVSFPAGIAKMNFWSYTIFTLIGSFAWNLILGTAGFFAGENYEDILPYLSKFEHFIWIILALGILYFIYLQIKEWKTITKKSEKERKDF